MDETSFNEKFNKPLPLTEDDLRSPESKRSACLLKNDPKIEINAGPSLDLWSLFLTARDDIFRLVNDIHTHRGFEPYYGVQTCALLKAIILKRCESEYLFDRERVSALRQNSISGWKGIDIAFWRLWIFCRLFGYGRIWQFDEIAQEKWLKGRTNAEGDTDGENHGPLSAHEIEDMLQLWICLKSLLRSHISSSITSGYESIGMCNMLPSLKSVACSAYMVSNILIDSVVELVMSLGLPKVLDILLGNDAQAEFCDLRKMLLSLNNLKELLPSLLVRPCERCQDDAASKG